MVWGRGGGGVFWGELPFSPVFARVRPSHILCPRQTGSLPENAMLTGALMTGLEAARDRLFGPAMRYAG